MSGKKTLEEYQIQDIATEVVNKRILEVTKNFVQRAEYDTNKITTDNDIKNNTKSITTLETKDQERDKDKRAMRLQMIGLGMGVALNVIIWVIAASSGFRTGG